MNQLIPQAVKFLSLKSFRLLHVAFLRPHLEYAIVAWCFYTKKEIIILEKVQIRDTNLVKRKKELSNEKSLKSWTHRSFKRENRELTKSSLYIKEGLVVMAKIIQLIKQSLIVIIISHV